MKYFPLKARFGYQTFNRTITSLHQKQMKHDIQQK